jgi:hypothetical protein
MQVFLGRELRLFTNSAHVKILKKLIRKIFLLIRAQAKSLILLEQAGCVPDEQFVAARMKSRFWHVKPQLRTKLSTQIVDSSKKAFCDDHLKKLLKNYVKNLAQVGPDVLPLVWDDSANSRRLIRERVLRAGMVQTWFSNCERRVP